MSYEFFADAILVAHVVLVSFVILGLLVTLVGGLCRWRWVRNPWFRVVHLGLISYIAVQALCGVTCPLTTWEWDLRRLAHPENWSGNAAAPFMHFLQSILFYDLGDQKWIFGAAYAGFALLVLLAFAAIPPRFRRTA